MRKFILVVVVLLQQAISFGQINPLIKYLPDSANMVVHINPVRIISKIPMETFSKSPVFEELMKDPKMPFGSMLSNPLSLGIDFFSGVFIIMVNDGENAKPGSNTSIFIKLSNAELFTAKMKELFKGEADSVIKKYGTDRILQTGKGMTIGWNNDVLVMTSGYDKIIKNEIQPQAEDTIPEKDYEIMMARLNEKKIKLQRNLCFELLTPKLQNTFSVNSHFIAFMNLEGDIKTWNNGMSMLGGNKIMGLLSGSMSKLPVFAHNQKTSILNFENGKIVIQSNSYLSEDIMAVYKKYPATSLNTDLVKRLPKGKILGMVNTSFNPQMGKEMMEKLGLKDKFEELKSKNQLPFDMSLVTESFGNNLMLAVVHADENEATDSITRSMKNMKLVLAMPIINKTKFDELKKSVLQLKDSMQKGKGESKMMKGMNPVVRNNESLFVLSLSPDVASAFLNNTGTENVPEWLQAKNHYPMVMNINLKEIFKMLMGKKMADKSDKGGQALLDMIDQLIIYGGNFENESISTTMEFRFTNQSENSLRQLIDLISAVADKKPGNNTSEEKKN